MMLLWSIAVALVVGAPRLTDSSAWWFGPHTTGWDAVATFTLLKNHWHSDPHIVVTWFERWVPSAPGLPPLVYGEWGLDLLSSRATVPTIRVTRGPSAVGKDARGLLTFLSANHDNECKAIVGIMAGEVDPPARRGRGVVGEPAGIEACWRDDQRDDTDVGADHIQTCTSSNSRGGDTVIASLQIVHRKGVISAVSVSAPEHAPDDENESWERFDCGPWGVVRSAPSPSHGAELAFEWDREGVLQSITTLRDGRRSGPMVVLRADHTIALVAQFLDDVPHGVWYWLAADETPIAAHLYVLGADGGPLPVELHEEH